MTETARKLLAAFDSLAMPDKQEVAIEILRRSSSGEAIPDEAFAELAAEVFNSYDAEESARAPS